MTDDQLLEGVCECGEKGPLGDICDICGGVFTEGRSEFEEFEDDDDLDYPKDMLKKGGNDDVVSLEELDEEEDDSVD